MSKYAIEVKNLVKKYKKSKVNAVDDISFNIKEGDFFALLGPNGAGKTTTLSILTTTLAKTKGQITISGFDLDKKPSEVRKRIGVIFQNPSLDLNLTAEENIRLHALLYNLYPYRPLYRLMPKAYKKRVSELSKILGIDKEIFSPVKSFSGGMKRKLEIIRSLMHNPKILFLDEPTSGLDPASRKNLWTYLSKVRKEENTTIFLTTHYLEEAEESDKLIVISNGKIIAQGVPDEIKKGLTKPKLILNTKDMGKLTKELGRKKIKHQIDSKGRVEISADFKKAHKLLKELKTPISYFKMHSPTLEEAYLKLIENE